MSKEWKNTFVVGRHKVEMTYSNRDGMRTVWNPEPARGSLSKEDLAQYRSGRDALLEEVAKAIGGKVLVVESSL